ncbi:MAG: hypothetical protein EOO15_21090 [Chitinophagaceae bacterium]|nr:MAG: hypothetical protein EOO15_21090 [Chitinophagaceae bacterium]
MKKLSPFIFAVTFAFGCSPKVSRESIKEWLYFEKAADGLELKSTLLTDKRFLVNTVFESKKLIEISGKVSMPYQPIAGVVLDSCTFYHSSRGSDDSGKIYSFGVEYYFKDSADMRAFYEKACSDFTSLCNKGIKMGGKIGGREELGTWEGIMIEEEKKPVSRFLTIYRLYRANRLPTLEIEICVIS